MKIQQPPPLFLVLLLLAFGYQSRAQTSPLTFEFGQVEPWSHFTTASEDTGKPLRWIDVNTTDTTWAVQENGELICFGRPIGVARSEKQYENFLLHVEWMHMEPGGNSGMFMWSSAIPGEENRLPDGVEVQMLELDWVNLNQRDGKKPPEAYVQGELFGVGGVETDPDNPRGTRSKSIEHRARGRGEWNTYDVVCVDGVIKLSFNGKFVNGISHSTQKKGYICLESEGAKIRFRNLKIVELPPGVTSAEQTAPEFESEATPSPLRKNQGFIFPEYPLLARSKAAVREQNPEVMPAFNALVAKAERALDAGPFTVMDKSYVPPSGDKHDYVSMGKYWWPDPDSPNGLPYIRRDGEINPEKADFDRDRLGLMMEHVQTLSLAYYFTGHEPYAAKAVALMDTWFLNPETKMNPHLNYGQHVPGREEGRSYGIIDTKGFAHFPDALNLIRSSQHFTAQFDRGMKDWFARYLDWLWDSSLGRAERGRRNNHSTSYDIQTAALALYLNDSIRYRELLTEVPSHRIDTQIEPDGKQPEELARTRSFSYSVSNTAYFMELGILGVRTDIPILPYEGPEGQSIAQALDFLIPYATGRQEWTYEQISPVDEVYPKLVRLFRQAAYHYGEDRYQEVATRISIPPSEGYATDLLYPEDLSPITTDARPEAPNKNE